RKGHGERHQRLLHLASMGPRSSDLGKGVKAYWAALEAAASMGPRSSDLGKAPVHWRSWLDGLLLQWGRDPQTSESPKSAARVARYARGFNGTEILRPRKALRRACSVGGGPL